MSGRKYIGPTPSNAADLVPKSYVDGNGILPTDLSALTSLAANDLLTLVDVSDTAYSASGTDKKLAIADLLSLQRQLLSNYSTANQGAGFAADTYLTGSNIAIPAGYPVAGTEYRLVFDVSKTAAGTAIPTINIRVGTAGSTADTSRGSLAFSAGTAATDEGVFEVIAKFRSVGSGTSAVLQSIARLTSQPTTGLSSLLKGAQALSGGFDSTTSGLIIGASYNGGTSAAHTVHLVRAELIV